MELRLRASEARREAARLQQLARAAGDHGGDRCCKDTRAVEQALLARAAEAEAWARQLETMAARS